MDFFTIKRRWELIGCILVLSAYLVHAVHFVTISYKGGSLGYEALTPAFDVAFAEGQKYFNLNYTWTNYELTNATSFCDQDALYQSLISTADLYKSHQTFNQRPVVIYFPGKR